MNYTVEEISPVERKIAVTVPTDEVNAAILATTALYARDVEMKGFRKGKVPTSMVESRFKKRILEEATGDLINVHIGEVLGSLKLTPLAGLKVDAGQLDKDADFTYAFSFEVAPKFDLPLYTGLVVEEEAVAIDDDEVGKVVDRIRDNLAELEDVTEPRKPVDGDVVIVSFAALGDAAFEGLKADNFQMEMGKGQSLPAFEEVIKSLDPGETKTQELDFPEDFINEGLAGKRVEMRIFLKEIKVKKLPEVTDELAAKAGFKDLDTMRQAIVASLSQNRKELVKSAAQKKLLDGLVEGLDFPLPPSLVEKNLSYIVSDQVSRLERRGKSLASTGKTVEELRSEFMPEALALTKTQVFLMAVATAEGLTVQPEEVDHIIRQAAAQTGQDYEQLRQLHERSGTVFDIKDRLLADKAMDLIYAHAEVREVPAAETKGEDA